MSRVLVVDDEPRYREHLDRALVREGHEVVTAGDGREAIIVGHRFHPDVLVADWMLKGSLHGLGVSEALVVTNPALKTILITGFSTRDLRSDATRHAVAKFLEKPFDIKEFCQLVNQVVSKPAIVREVPNIGVMEVTKQGDILAPNDWAKMLLTAANAECSVDGIWHLFTEFEISLLTEAQDKWVTLSPLSNKEEVWQLRSTPVPDETGWIVVILREEDRKYRENPAVKCILDVESPVHVKWPTDGHVLLVDGSDCVRRAVGMQLRRSKAICHTAESLANAKTLFERDPEISVVVVDHDFSGTAVYDFIRDLKAHRPSVQVVGTCASSRVDEFRHLGVNLFLLKPWVVTDLIDLVIGRLGRCHNCGRELPLRCPESGEVSDCWECLGCGEFAVGVFDESASPTLTQNVRRVSGSEC